jgi:hypothetical protein
VNALYTHRGGYAFTLGVPPLYWCRGVPYRISFNYFPTLTPQRGNLGPSTVPLFPPCLLKGGGVRCVARLINSINYFLLLSRRVRLPRSLNSVRSFLYLFVSPKYSSFGSCASRYLFQQTLCYQVTWTRDAVVHISARRVVYLSTLGCVAPLIHSRPCFRRVGAVSPPKWSGTGVSASLKPGIDACSYPTFPLISDRPPPSTKGCSPGTSGLFSVGPLSALRLFCLLFLPLGRPPPFTPILGPYLPGSRFQTSQSPYQTSPYQNPSSCQAFRFLALYSLKP